MFVKGVRKGARQRCTQTGVRIYIYICIYVFIYEYMYIQYLCISIYRGRDIIQYIYIYDHCIVLYYLSEQLYEYLYEYPPRLSSAAAHTRDDSGERLPQRAPASKCVRKGVAKRYSQRCS